MVQKTNGRKVYKSMQGKTIDMDLLRQRNELTPAVGNAKVNARGDELGAGGKIVRSKEDLLKEYYENTTGVPDELAVKQQEKDLTDDWVEPEQVKKAAKTTKKEEVVEDNEWVEDDEGNFVKKGD